MNRTKLLLLALAGVFAVACATDPVDSESVAAQSIAAKKFVNTSASAVEGELIIYVDEATAETLISAECATRSGVTALDAVAIEIGASDLKPVFNLKVNAEQKRELNMHRWFAMTFPSEVSLEVAAQSLAQCDVVERVQFSTMVEAPKAQFAEVDPAEVAQTRAEEYPFNDPMLPLQWHYRNLGLEATFPNAKAGADINLFPAWEQTAGRADVIVAVVDEGIYHDHEDLKDNMYANEAELNGTDGIDDDNNGYVDDVYGYNFVHGGRVTWSRNGDSGHATHVAGTVAAVNNNGIGVAGVAGGSGKGDGVKMISCQIISGGTAAGTNATAKAVEYAADRGACILQNSWGFKAGDIQNDAMFESGATSVEKTAFDYFASKKNHPNLEGGIIIFAAGNDGKPVAGYPAAYNEYISVTAIGADGLPTYYTCYDRGCNVAAPGGEFAPNGTDAGCVVSTLPYNKYGRSQGTSMACPHVSGIAALALSYAADNGIVLTLPELQDIILSSVNDINASLTGFKTKYEGGGTMNLTSYKNKMGTGIIDAYRVLMAVRGTKCIPLPLNKQAIIDVSYYLGDGNITVKMLESQIGEDVCEKLGVTDMKFIGNKLLITCTKPGSALVTLKYIAGGSFVGGGQITGGMEAQQEFAFIVRDDVVLDENTLAPVTPGGWL